MLRSSIYQFHFQVLHQGLQPQARRRSRHVRKVCHVRAQAEDVQADIGLAPKPELKPPPSRPIPQPQQRRAAGNDVSFKKPAKGGEDERYGKRPYLTGEDRRRAGYADRKRDNGGRHNSGREGGRGNGTYGRPAASSAPLEATEVVTAPEIPSQNGASDTGPEASLPSSAAANSEIENEGLNGRPGPVQGSAGEDTPRVPRSLQEPAREDSRRDENPSEEAGKREDLPVLMPRISPRSVMSEAPSASSSASRLQPPELAAPPAMTPPPVRPMPTPQAQLGDVRAYRKQQNGGGRNEKGSDVARGSPPGGRSGPPRAVGGPPRAEGAAGAPSRPGSQRDQPPRGPPRGAAGQMHETPFGRYRKGDKKQAAAGAVAVESRRSSRQQRKAARQEERRANAVVREDIFEVGPEGMPVSELAQKLAVGPADVIKSLFMKGIMSQVNQVLDAETVKLVAADFEVEVLDRDEGGVETMARKTTDYLLESDMDYLQIRPPVVTVMGHVDHGKTSLLDYIRDTKVAVGEAGGITQAIGAYTCEVPFGEDINQITFLDTPGHEAFSAMRARGTRVTDIAIIVVAADDGVRPQTLEAIAHAQAAQVPIVVAINKVDKEGANVERVKQEMAEAGLLPEEWGGSAQMVPISAKTGEGVDSLLETVLLVAEVEQLMANPDKNAVGTVIEAHLDRRTGPVASLLIAAGTLRPGDVVVAGTAYGKVRTLVGSRGDVEEAGPSVAVQMVGLNTVPTAGDEFRVCETEQEARRQAEEELERSRIVRLAEQAGTTMVTVQSLASMDDGDMPMEALQRLNVIVKADVSGTLEAIKSALGTLPQDRVALRFLLAAPGEITASDVDLAYASAGVIIGFNTEPGDSVLALAKQRGVEIVTYRVIYDLVDEMRVRMEGRLAAVEERVDVGEAQVRAIFGGGSGKVAGCLVTDGYLRRDCHVDVMRGRKRQVVHTGKLSSLRRVKDAVKEVPAGTECGAAIDGFLDWEEGDIIACYELRSRTRTLEEASNKGQPALAAV